MASEWYPEIESKKESNPAVNKSKDPEISPSTERKESPVFFPSMVDAAEQQIRGILQPLFFEAMAEIKKAIGRKLQDVFSFSNFRKLREDLLDLLPEVG